MAMGSLYALEKRCRSCPPRYIYSGNRQSSKGVTALLHSLRPHGPFCRSLRRDIVMRTLVRLGLLTSLSVALSGCAGPGGMYDTIKSGWTLQYGSKFEIVRSGCDIRSGEFFNRSTAPANPMISFVATNSDGRTIGSWRALCESAISGGSSNCRIISKGNNDFVAAGGMGCPGYYTGSLKIVEVVGLR